MKYIKKAIQGILALFLTSLIILFTISTDMKKVIVNGIVMEVVKYQISGINYKEGNTNQKTIFDYKTDNEQINEILQSKEVQDLVSKYIDLMIESMTDDKQLEDIDIEQDMINYIKENKEVIEEKAGVEITEEALQETEQQIKEQNLNETIKESLKKTKEDLSESQKKTLKGYTFLTSTKLKVILIILMIIDCVFIILLQIKENKWIYIIGNSVFTSGLGIIIMSIIVKIIISKLSNIPILKLSILIEHGIIELLIGLFVMITYKIIINKKLKRKERKTSEISEISEYEEF